LTPPFAVLDHDDVKRMLSMRDCIEIVREALVSVSRGAFEQVPRAILTAHGTSGAVAVMTASRGHPTDAFAVKVVGFFPENAAAGLATHQGAMVVLDGQTGVVAAVVDAGAVTELRTAAVSAVATAALAREDAATLAVLGSGRQARAHVEAIALVRRLRSVRIWSRTRTRAEALADEVRREMSLRVETAETAADAVRGADVVVTATASPEPVLAAAWLNSGTHVNAVGGAPGSSGELDPRIVVSNSVFVESKDATLSENNEIRTAVLDGVIPPSHIRAEIGDVVSGRAVGRTASDEITVFRSLGIAAEDLAVGAWLARRTGAR
jgi:ornithine cyclodeaminase/alanine dehydrogenase-like protein (mu-crystallin family)